MSFPGRALITDLGRRAALALRRLLQAGASRTINSRLLPAAMKSGLQRRLLLLLLVPLGIFALLGIYFDYQTAGNVAQQKDQQLLRLLPLLADSVVAPGITPDGAPLLLLAPAVQDFLKGRTGSSGFRISAADGEFLAGDSWVAEVLPSTPEPDLSAIDPLSTPAEVQPLVSALNRLFGLVNDQAESQRRFVADAAHQLRTPLAGLQAQVEAWAQAAQAAQGKSADGAITLSADKIIKLRSATRRTSQLANQLLALSRADASTAAAQPTQRVDLKDLCESILPLHLDAATHKGIDLGLEAQAAQVSGYEWLLRELLSNLVDNAVKYTPPGGTVTIRCGPVAGYAGHQAPAAPQAPAPASAGPAGKRWGGFLEVEDDGPGIAPQERSKALQRFYRVLGTEGEGNGLGLAIADEIARVHHSQLELADASMGDGETAHGSRGLRVRLSL